MVDAFAVTWFGSFDQRMHRQIGGNCRLDGARRVGFNHHLPWNARLGQAPLDPLAKDAVFLEGEAQRAVAPGCAVFRADPDEWFDGQGLAALAHFVFCG